ncbi:MAG: UMP kinase [Candidatus Bathyarchaeota archaeon]
MKATISLGGSLLTGDKNDTTLTLTPEPYRTYATVLRQLHGLGHQLMVVCGGGKPARHYIQVAKNLDASRSIQDMLGVKATHINALLLTAALGDAADQTRVYTRATELRYRQTGKIWVGGGYRPKSSTDYRAVLLARALGSDTVINATDVPGIYDSNPRTNPGARKLDMVTHAQLERIIKKSTRQAPGEYGLFDLKAVKLAARINMPLIFIDGRDPEELRRAVEGGHSGTVVKTKPPHVLIPASQR